jgi:hypothetical protein
VISSLWLRPISENFVAEWQTAVILICN